MKKLLLLSVIFFKTFFINAQVVQDWAAGMPPMTTNYYNHTVATDSQGNVYSIGTYDGVSRDFDSGPGVFTMNSFDRNMYIVKVNAAGNFVWAKQIGGGSIYASSAANAIIIDSSDNLYITGNSYSYFGVVNIDFDPGIGVVNVTNTNGKFVMYVLKLDANGNHLMNKQFKDGTLQYPPYINALTIDTAGNIYGTGGFWGTLDFDPDAGVTNLTSVGRSYDSNIFVMKLNATGSLAWAKAFFNNNAANAGIDEGYGIGVDTFGNVYSTGYYWKSIDADPGTGVFNLIANTTNNATGANTQYISKLDGNGNFVWAYDLFGNHSVNVLPSLVVDNSNNIIISGYNEQSAVPDYDFSNGIYTLPIDTSAFIFKINANAGLIWAKSAARESVVNASHGSFSPGLALDLAGNIYATGSFGVYGPVDFDPNATNYFLNSAGANDGFVSKLDTNGNFAWATKVGGTGDDYCFSIAVSPLGKVTVFGKTSTGFNKSVAAVTSGGFLASFSQPALAMSQFELNQNIVVYPNPSTGEFNIKIDNDLLGANAAVYNILGQKVNQFTLDVSITSQNLDKGMYLIEIEKNNNKITKKLIVK